MHVKTPLCWHRFRVYFVTPEQQIQTPGYPILQVFEHFGDIPGMANSTVWDVQPQYYHLLGSQITLFREVKWRCINRSSKLMNPWTHFDPFPEILSRNHQIHSFYFRRYIALPDLKLGSQIWGGPGRSMDPLHRGLLYIWVSGVSNMGSKMGQKTYQKNIMKKIGLKSASGRPKWRLKREFRE